MNTIKPLYLICIFQLLICSANGQSPKVIQRDTIEFSLRQDFAGDCDKDCYRFLGTDNILKINGRPAGQNCNHIFVKCPSKLTLYRDKVYRFVATSFVPNNCSTIIDTCAKNLTYLLIAEVR